MSRCRTFIQVHTRSVAIVTLVDHDEFRALIAQNIRRAAARRRLSMSALAREAGVSRSHVFAIVYGERAATTDTLLKLSVALGTEPWRLLKPTRARG